MIKSYADVDDTESYVNGDKQLQICYHLLCYWQRVDLSPQR